MMVKDMVAVVAAATPSRGIGYQGQMPWRIPGDMQHFKRVTTEPPAAGCVNAVVMGRKTWESIPKKFRPLVGRTNVVLTRRRDPATGDGISGGCTTSSFPSDVIVAGSMDEAAAKLGAMENLGSVFVIGGAQVYEQAMKRGFVDRIIYTEVSDLPEDVNTKFDVFFPQLDESEWERKPYVPSSGGDDDDKENSNNADDDDVGGDGGDYDSNNAHVDPKSGISYRFVEYTKRRSPSPCGSIGTTTTTKGAATSANPEEEQYLNLCRDIMETGIRRGDRTGTGTLSKFGTQMRFSLRDGTMPLLTTKRTFWRGLAEELLWFISGNTNANDLAAKNIHIWDGNGSREFLDGRGLGHREVGDLGPVYGFQWRHFGAEYVDMHTDYAGRGVDQLADCIDKIKNHPEDRRIIMSAWNPADLHLMALPPCHMFCQFYVDVQRNEVSCQMYQRSADMGLGVPFNIASYALLTHMVAHVTGRKPGDFVHTIGDAHVYMNHCDALREQLTRQPRPFPKLRINPDKMNGSIDDFRFEDFELVGYNPHKTIKMKMAV